MLSSYDEMKKKGVCREGGRLFLGRTYADDGDIGRRRT